MGASSHVANAARLRLTTSHRLYNATPRQAGARAALFTRLFEELDLQVETIAHAWPQPVADLWNRPGLCCAFMCGWPYAKAVAQQLAMPALAAPVPAFAAYDGKARYRSEFLMREESGPTSLEQSFGQRYGWMVDDSQSGWNAPRAHLSQYLNDERRALFAAVHGPYGNPRGLLQALQNREIDVTALDSFYLDLLRADGAPELRGLATVAVTEWTLPPLLVAAADVEERIVDALRNKLVGLHDDDTWHALLADAHIARFDPVAPNDYRRLLDVEETAIRRGYPLIR
jgi:ABC-type phosphate/phosphonate transport system substrate-binding protein